MPTTRTERTKPSSTRTERTKPVRYIELLQDSFDSVRDLDGEDIYVYASTGTPVGGTIWTERTPI